MRGLGSLRWRDCEVAQMRAAYGLGTVCARGAQGGGAQCALGLNGETPAGSE